MNVFQWLVGHFSNRGRALSFYRRGVRKARNHRHEEAIDDYTTAIGMSSASPDVKAMAQYDRALVHLATKNDPEAIADLNFIVAMKETLINIKTMARQELARIKRPTPTRRL